jgi:choline dehydrogenase
LRLARNIARTSNRFTQPKALTFAMTLSNSRDAFDYIIIGAGAAGAILANRLTEDGASTVCLLEAGPPDTHPLLHIPAGYIKSVFNPKLSWQFSSEPHPLTSNRRIPLPQGRTLGGSSSINGLVYNRGQKEDFDGWAEAGCPGWSYEEVLPYFKRNEKRLGAADLEYRGVEGPVPVSNIERIHPICERFMDGAESLGLPRNPDYNAASQLGVGYFQRTIAGRWRMSTARTYLKPIKHRIQLDIRTNALASKILFEGKRAIGVQYALALEPSVRKEVYARREVLVCSGALNTPKLLQLSGLGPASLLQAKGIPVLHELAGVGENLSDHFSIRLAMRVKNSLTINELSKGPRLLGQIAKWMLGQPSILSLSPSLVHWFANSKDGLSRPDLQGVFSPASYREGYVGRLDNYPGMTCGVWAHRPHSRGYVHLASNDPFSDPIIQPNYLSDERDQVTLLAGMKLARKLLNTSALSHYEAKETLPGSQVDRDAEMLDFAKRFGVSSYHVNGTARMGPASDAGSVVDHQLRVHGLHGLRVVDASVMPTIPSANTCAATMMIAEKAADMIKGGLKVQKSFG